MKPCSIFFAMFSVILTSSGGACELTDEFVELKQSFEERSRFAIGLCESALSESEGWFRYVQCLDRGDFENHEEGCGFYHDRLNEEYRNLGLDIAFCGRLDPGTPEMQAQLAHLAKTAGVRKCK